MEDILASRKNTDKLSDWRTLYARLFQVGDEEYIPTSGTYYKQSMLLSPLETSS